jgi:ADP-ribosylglycohydrolase
MDEDLEGLMNYARNELKALSEQGCETWELERRVELIGEEGAADAREQLEALCHSMENLKPGPDFPYDEPSELDEIRARCPEGPRHIAVPLSTDALEDKTRGAWLGRIAGCMLGKPVEGWSRDKIADLMEVCGLEELTDYLPECPDNNRGVELPEGSPVLRPNITRGVRDDDIDYTIVGLRVLEDHGRHFEPRQVAEFWLGHLPYRRTYTAERAAYRNFVNDLWPPRSATHRNPYREWIGAQIRADAFGYGCPGRPEEAASLAFKDACISHVKNGIYGEMWVAAMLATAFVTDDITKVVEVGLTEIPKKCRLAEAIREVVAWREENLTAEEALDNIMEEYGHYHRVHTINNAAIVARALLWGEKDFSRTVGLAVQPGLDTDCNGATAGSVLGALLGADAIPEHWVEPLNDRVETAVFGEAGLTISGLAARTRTVQDSA